MRAGRRPGTGIGLILALLALASCAQEIKITAPRYALVYGVSTYSSSVSEGMATSNGIMNLRYSDDDAQSIAALMTSEGWNVSSRIKGSVISVNPAADKTTYWPTKSQMTNDIIALSSSISAESIVLIYFSGHGDSENGVPYIIPYLGISDTIAPTLNRSNWISPADLNSMLSTLPTKNIIVIFDTCYSGGFADPGTAIDASPQDYSQMSNFSTFSTAIANFGNLLSANAQATGEKAPIVLSAAGSLESSYDGTDGTYGTINMQHGVFTYYLLQSVASGDSNSDGVITTSEAYQYTSSMIKGWGTNQALSGYPNGYPFLPHLSGGARDLVLFTK
jgi:hypothetical protein